MQAILFDLDGTLIDNVEQFVKAFQETYKGMFKGELKREAILKASGRRSTDVVKALYIPKLKQQDFIKEFRLYREKMGGDATKLVKGVPRVLSVLEEQGTKLAVVSSKRKEKVLQDLANLGIKSHFSVILGSEDVRRHKPDPDALYAACDMLNVKPSKTVAYVGDTTFDIQAANTGGLFSIGVTWGAHGEKLRETNPDLIISKFEELLELKRTDCDD